MGTHGIKSRMRSRGLFSCFWLKMASERARGVVACEGRRRRPGPPPAVPIRTADSASQSRRRVPPRPRSTRGVNRPLAPLCGGPASGRYGARVHRLFYARALLRPHARRGAVLRRPGYREAAGVAVVRRRRHSRRNMPHAVSWTVFCCIVYRVFFSDFTLLASISAAARRISKSVAFAGSFST